MTQSVRERCETSVGIIGEAPCAATELLHALEKTTGHVGERDGALMCTLDGDEVMLVVIVERLSCAIGIRNRGDERRRAKILMTGCLPGCVLHADQAAQSIITETRRQLGRPCDLQEPPLGIVFENTGATQGVNDLLTASVGAPAPGGDASGRVGVAHAIG